ncbi:hypothetical protein F5879DRAFT_927082 [Lentinula edodes]|nr:hypothetical protein F5879DRAFT_927082 [Lentinula edodes]
MGSTAGGRGRGVASAVSRGCNSQELVVEIRKEKGKGRAKVQAQLVGGDLDNDEEDRAPCKRCKNKKLPCQMQAGKRSSVICKPCHDTKVSVLGAGWSSKGAMGTATEDRNNLVVAGTERCDP